MQTKSTFDFNNDPNSQQKKQLFREVFKAPTAPQKKSRPEESPNQKETKNIDADSANEKKESISEEKKIEEAQTEAHKELLKESAKEEEKAAQQLDNLVETANLILFQTDSANPLEIFTNSLTVDTAKVSIIQRQFFGSERVHSVMIKDVSDVFIDTSPFFAKLSIVDSGFTENEVAIEYLKKTDAIRARRIIQGLVVASQKGIDFGQLQKELSRDEIVEKIEKLGKARIDNIESTSA